MPGYLAKPPKGSPLNRADPLAQGMVGAWLFNDKGGGVADSIGKANGTPTNQAGSTWATSPWGPAMTNPRIICADSASLRTTAATVAAVVRFTSFSNCTLFAHNYNGPPWSSPFSAFYLRGSTSTSLAGGRGAGSGGFTLPVALSLNVWYTIALSINSTRAIVYYVGPDGVVYQSSTQAGGAIAYNPGFPQSIGGSFAGNPLGEGFVGGMAGVCRWNYGMGMARFREFAADPWRPWRPHSVSLLMPPAGNSYTGTGALTAAGATLAASATFVGPTYTGVAALTAAGASLSASATFVAPTYTGAASLTAGAASLSASATFTAPVYTGTGTLTAASATLAATALFATAVYSGAGALTAAASTLSAAATFKPTFTGSGSLVAAGASLSAAASFTAPVYTGSGALGAAGAVLSAIAQFAGSLRTAIANLFAAAATISASATGSESPPGVCPLCPSSPDTWRLTFGLPGSDDFGGWGGTYILRRTSGDPCVWEGVLEGGGITATLGPSDDQRHPWGLRLQFPSPHGAWAEYLSYEDAWTCAGPNSMFVNLSSGFGDPPEDPYIEALSTFGRIVLLKAVDRSVVNLPAADRSIVSLKASAEGNA